MSKNKQAYVEEALGNIREDREKAKKLLDDCAEQIGKVSDGHQSLGMVASKYLESLHKSNEQLIKVAQIKDGTEEEYGHLDPEELDDLFEKLEDESRVALEEEKKGGN